MSCRISKSYAHLTDLLTVGVWTQTGEVFGNVRLCKYHCLRELKIDFWIPDIQRWPVLLISGRRIQARDTTSGYLKRLPRFTERHTGLMEMTPLTVTTTTTNRTAPTRVFSSKTATTENLKTAAAPPQNTTYAKLHQVRFTRLLIVSSYFCRECEIMPGLPWPTQTFDQLYTVSTKNGPFFIFPITDFNGFWRRNSWENLTSIAYTFARLTRIL